MAEYDTEEPPDERFAEEDTRKGREGQLRTDKNVAGRFYLAMPDVTALTQLVSELTGALAKRRRTRYRLRSLQACVLAASSLATMGSSGSHRLGRLPDAAADRMGPRKN